MFGILAQTTSLTHDDVVKIIEAVQQQQQSGTLEIASQVVLIIVGAIGLPAFLGFVWYVVKRMNSGEVRFTKIEGDVASISDNVTRSEEAHKQVAVSISKLDDRLDTTQIQVAEANKDVKHMTARLEDFLGDNRTGRGITAKIKQAVRDIVSPDILTKAEDTLYPEMAAEAVEELHPMTAASSSDEDTDKVQPSARGLMRPLKKPVQQAPKTRSNPLMKANPRKNQG